MEFITPIPFDEALQKLGSKDVVLSPLRSAQWREKVPAALRDRAFFSSTLENARVAQAMKDFIGDFLAKAYDPETGGLNAGSRAEFVAELRELCIREGLGKLDPETGSVAEEIDESDLTDLRSMARLQLIFDVQTEAAHEYGFWAQGNDPDLLHAFPAQRFIRIRPVRVPRPLHAENEGKVRRKDDLDFWLAMNPDFGVPYGPWGFNSGMGVEDVDRLEAIELGLIGPDEEISPPDRDLNDRLSAGVRDLDPDLRSELKSIFGPQIRETQNGRLEWAGGKPIPEEVVPDPEGRGTISIPDDIYDDLRQAASTGLYRAGFSDEIFDGVAPARAAKFKRIEREWVAGSPVEHSILLRPDGRIDKRVGTVDSVSWPHHLLADAIVSHAHPQGGSFSPSDIAELLKSQVRGIRVIGGGRIYSALPGESAPDLDPNAPIESLREFDSFKRRAYALVDRLSASFRWNALERAQCATHLCWVELHRAGWIRYSVQKL